MDVIGGEDGDTRGRGRGLDSSGRKKTRGCGTDSRYKCIIEVQFRTLYPSGFESLDVWRDWPLKIMLRCP